MPHPLERIDLNLLVYLDVLLDESNVTRAAQRLGISQPAMSNGLKRLRETFNDPLLVRTSDGMTPTARADALRAPLREILAGCEAVIRPVGSFQATTSDRVFRIMASDYAETTLLPAFLKRLRHDAPLITVDILTPSDVVFRDVEQGKLDLVINRFDDLPVSFHSAVLWRDAFACVVAADRPVPDTFDLNTYLNARHVWVSKTGMGVGVGIDPADVQRLGWVDEALARIGKKRNIAVFTRHYPAAIQHAEQQDLIATVPLRAAREYEHRRHVRLLPPPFPIPEMELTMAWSPLAHADPGHRWFRGLVRHIATESSVEALAATG
ncbi:MAG: LysR family transcriptional regulator [Pseudomonadota bacterium]